MSKNTVKEKETFSVGYYNYILVKSESNHNLSLRYYYKFFYC